MRLSRHQLFALILGAGMTTALQAQARPAPPARPRAGAAGARGGGPGGMRRPAGPAAMMINQREQLGLSDDQVTQLQALETANAGTPPVADMMQLRKELQTATAGEANLDAARVAMDKIGHLETDMLVARLDARNKARAVLTPDQQAKFDAAEAAHPMQPMGGMGAMGGPPGGGRGGARGRQGGPPPPPPPAI